MGKFNNFSLSADASESQQLTIQFIGKQCPLFLWIYWSWLSGTRGSCLSKWKRWFLILLLPINAVQFFHIPFIVLKPKWRLFLFREQSIARCLGVTQASWQTNFWGIWYKSRTVKTPIYCSIHRYTVFFPCCILLIIHNLTGGNAEYGFHPVVRWPSANTKKIGGCYFHQNFVLRMKNKIFIELASYHSSFYAVKLLNKEQGNRMQKHDNQWNIKMV